VNALDACLRHVAVCEVTAAMWANARLGEGVVLVGRCDQCTELAKAWVRENRPAEGESRA
jgi:hypothetical protein